MQILPAWPPVACSMKKINGNLHATDGHSGSTCMRLAATWVQFVCDWWHPIFASDCGHSGTICMWLEALGYNFMRLAASASIFASDWRPPWYNLFATGSHILQVEGGPVGGSCAAQSHHGDPGVQAGKGIRHDIGCRLLVYSDMDARCCCWRTDVSGNTLLRTKIRGLWSVQRGKVCPRYPRTVAVPCSQMECGNQKWPERLPREGRHWQQRCGGRGCWVWRQQTCTSSGSGPAPWRQGWRRASAGVPSAAPRSCCRYHFHLKSKNVI